MSQSPVTRHPSPPPSDAKHLGGWPRFWMTLGPVFALMSLIMTGVAAAALLGLGASRRTPDNELARLGAELMDNPRASQVSLAAVGGRKGCKGKLVLSPGRDVAFLKAEQLSKCPQGRNYALWMRGSDGRSRRLARFAVEADGSSSHLLNLGGPWSSNGPVEFSVTQDSGAQAGEPWLQGSLSL